MKRKSNTNIHHLYNSTKEQKHKYKEEKEKKFPVIFATFIVGAQGSDGLFVCGVRGHWSAIGNKL